MPASQLFGAAAPAQGGKGPICASAGPKVYYNVCQAALCGNAPASQHMGTAMRGYGTAHISYGSRHSLSEWRTKYKLKGHCSHKRVSCATWDLVTNQVCWFQLFTKPWTPRGT
jgi:hypothetical protein